MGKYRNTLQLLLVMMAVCCLVVFSTLPHHHHSDGNICFQLERCLLDGGLNDTHTAHHTSDDQPDDCGCKMKADKAGWHHKLHLLSHRSDAHLLSLLMSAGLPAKAFDYLFYIESGHQFTATSSNQATPDFIRSSGSLRAPPCYLA